MRRKPIPLYRSCGHFSSDEIAMIDRCAVAGVNYLNQVDRVQCLSSAAVFMRHIPYFGRFFLHHLDEAVYRLGEKWDSFRCILEETERALDEKDFAQYTESGIRREVDRDWPESRCIRLPSDTETAHA